MPRHYLNAHEKDEALTLTAFMIYVEDKAKKWAELKKNKLQLKYIRMACAFLRKTLDIIFADIDNDEVAAALQKLNKMEVVVKYKDVAVREYKKMLELDSVIPMEIDDLYTLAELGLGVCQACKNQGDAVTGCKYRKLFTKYEVEAFNLDAPPGVCQYKIAK